jgi:hypothetical protein
MAKPSNHVGVAFSSTLDLQEDELRALDALTKYGEDAFLDVFYAQLGTAYLKPNEAGLRSLFSSIRGTVTPALKSIDEARALLNTRIGTAH